MLPKICWRSDRLPTPVFLAFPCGSAGKESGCNVGDLGSIPVLGKSPEEGKDYPLQYSGLENSMYSIVHGVAKSRTQLTFTFFIEAYLTALRKISHPNLLLRIYLHIFKTFLLLVFISVM